MGGLLVEDGPLEGMRRFVSKRSGPVVALVARVHGNEPVGDQLFARLEPILADRLDLGEVWLFRANLAAARLNLRHTPEGSDLNRLFDAESLQRIRAVGATSYEEGRAVELAAWLERADLVFDLHSTSRPSLPHLVVRDDRAHAALARRLGVRHIVTGLHENAILSGGICSNVGLAVGQAGPRLGMTFEAGQHLNAANVERAAEVVHRLLTCQGLWQVESAGSGAPEVEFFEVTDRFLQAPAGAEPWRFVHFVDELGNPQPGPGSNVPPTRRLESFEEVAADEPVLQRGDGEVFRAAGRFTMLMPAPATPPGTDLFYFTQRRHGGLGLSELASPAEILSVATGVERMTDLLADDAFGSHASWVAFEPRQLLDLCAAVVSRNLRLPEGHPHRRLVVVGRGELRGHESESRIGQRYRQVMKAALAGTAPVERVQVLRGATRDWIEALTGPAMEKLLRERERVGGPPVRLRLVSRQPDTLSLLVAGDLKLALETQQSRYLRLALLIEAASVEPDGPEAFARIARAGLVSARPELNAACASLLDALAADHRATLARLDAPSALMDAEGALLLVPGRLPALRTLLRRAQSELWRRQLQEAEVRPQVLPPSQVGQWLADRVLETGIRDGDLLRSLFVHPHPEGAEIVPQEGEPRLLRLRAFVDGSGAERPPRIARRPSPVQPLMAADLMPDELERWVGWKRFVRTVQQVSDLRGRDLDLAFDPAATLDRLAERLEEAATREDHLVVLAGDGLHPADPGAASLQRFARAHDALLRTGRAAFWRIQHAPSAHLPWLRAISLAYPQDDRGRVRLYWEANHGGSVNIVLVGRRLADRSGDVLDDWEVRFAAVLVTDLEGRGSDRHPVAMISDAKMSSSGINLELVHFARQYLQALLVGPPLDAAAFDRRVVHQLDVWLGQLRGYAADRAGPWTPDEVQAALGLADPLLAGRLAQALAWPEEGGGRLWSSTTAWSGVD